MNVPDGWTIKHGMAGQIVLTYLMDDGVSRAMHITEKNSPQSSGAVLYRLAEAMLAATPAAVVQAEPSDDELLQIQEESSRDTIIKFGLSGAHSQRRNIAFARAVLAIAPPSAQNKLAARIEALEEALGECECVRESGCESKVGASECYSAIEQLLIAARSAK